MNRSAELEVSLFDGLSAEHQQRLSEVLDEYLAGLERGRPLDRSQLLARFPDLAEPLAAYLESLDFLQDAAAGFCPTAQSLDLPPTESTEMRQVGDFQVIREIGRGGMGVVYEARQLSLNRRVALKVLPFAALLDSKQIARFRNEAQAAAQLHHPRIVPVFAVGTDRGVHYYAMQYIDGQPLDRAIADLRRAAAARGLTERSNFAETSLTGSLGHKTSATNTTVADPLRRAVPAGHAARTDFAQSNSCRSDLSPPDLGPLDSGPSDSGPSDSGRSDSCWSLISQYAEDGRQYFRSVARLAIQAAEALHAAHEVGVVHRDIKPSNLLLDAEGNLWVTDFGLARCRGDARLTRTGDCVGTMRYMSPEQSRGQSHLVDHRADIYALGLTLYELLTLRHAVRGEDPVAILRQLDRDQPYRPRLWNSSIPLDLENIVQKAIAKSRDERYATARELAEDLQRFLDGRPTIAQKPSWTERAAKFGWRHRRSVVVAVGALLLITGGFGTSTALLLSQQRKTDQALEESRANSQQYRAQLALKQNHLAMLLRKDGDAPRAEDGFEEAIRLQREVLRESPDDDEALANLAASLCNLSVLCLDRDVPRAIRLAEEATGLHEKRLRLHPDRVEAVRDLARTRGQLGGGLRRQGQPQLAIDQYRLAIDLLDRFSNRAEVARDLAVSLNNLGMLLAATGQVADAERTFRRALDKGEVLTQQASVSGPNDSSSLGGIHNNLGTVLERQGRLDEAATAFLQAARLQQAAHAQAPDDARFASLLNTHYQHASRVLRNLGRFQEAVDVTLARRPLCQTNSGQLADSGQLVAIDDELAALRQRIRQSSPSVFLPASQASRSAAEINASDSATGTKPRE